MIMRSSPIPMPGGTQPGEEAPEPRATPSCSSPSPNSSRCTLRKIAEPIVASIKGEGEEPANPRAAELTTEER